MASNRSIGGPLALSLLFHLTLFLLLAFHLSARKLPAQPSQPEVMEAVMMDEAQINAELLKIEKSNQSNPGTLATEQTAIQKPPEHRPEEAEKTQHEAIELKEAETRREAEAEAAIQIKAEENAKKQAELEARRALEAESKKEVEEEARRLDETLARKKAEEERQRLQLSKDALKEQLEAEQNAAADKQAVLNEAQAWIVNKIKPKIERHTVNRSGLSCIIEVDTLPGGEVAKAKIVSSSGDSAFDLAVEAAVLKASPLPWPGDVKIAQELKSFRLIVKSQ